MTFPSFGETPATSATPPLDVLKILTLQRRDAVLEAVEDYYKKLDAESDPPFFFVTSRVRSLFIDLEPALRRSYNTEDEKAEFLEMERVAFDTDVNKSIELFRKLCQFLDEKNLTKWDNQKKINTAMVETENEEKGL